MMTATQQLMNMRLPAGDHVTAKDIAAATGWSERTILDAIANGKIHGFAANARAKRGQEVITRKRIPRECAILYMVKTATFDADSLVDDLFYCLDRLDRHSLARVHAHAARELARR